MSEPPNAIPPGFVTAGHAILFEELDPHRCDVCGTSSLPGAESADDAQESGYDVSGSGLLVWSRGEERRYQEPPLCAACAAAIGVSALQRWETEEDEG